MRVAAKKFVQEGCARTPEAEDEYGLKRFRRLNGSLITLRLYAAEGGMATRTRPVCESGRPVQAAMSRVDLRSNRTPCIQRQSQPAARSIVHWRARCSIAYVPLTFLSVV